MKKDRQLCLRPSAFILQPSNSLSEYKESARSINETPSARSGCWVWTVCSNWSATIRVSVFQMNAHNAHGWAVAWSGWVSF